MGSVSAYAQFSVKNDTDYPVYFFSDSEPGQAETIPVQESREWSGARQHLLACYRVDSEKFYCSAPALDNPDDRNLVVVGRCDERCLHQRLGPKVCYCGTHWTISLFW
ncbi:MAG: hypothetical protein COV52_05230 [Gammaproteobacteria bacterium CG11_big_fil_rev_8_21_14_0_20_46_22]|nr:MAG: hypothetical protein COW05_10025 [Gammaproteobacteria bacterium CG12_big_fil_rev_8_21_14_0_65_46_12]PIR11199.1 MAG: hypothetical protein COV52_05230 [Gammaproteobacteria bacterium CG11_big_fil_rev_8_21_14_0_20_46_22]